MTINVRDLIADAILNAECENQPKCTGCMSASVVAELDRAGLIIVSAEDLANVLQHADPMPGIDFDALARLRAALPERTEVDG